MANDDIFWTMDNYTIDDYFKEFIENEYPTFKFTFTWKDFSEIKDYLIRLMYSSYSHSKRVRQQLPELIHDVEMFFAAGLASRVFSKKNIPTILANLKKEEDGFRIIEFLPPKLAGVYGNSTQDRIQINQNMTRHSNSPALSSSEVRRLYMFHEMGHKILNIVSQEEIIDKYIATIGAVLQSKGLEGVDLSFANYVKHGFWMLEESLTQELAEYLTYFSLHKPRPNYETRRDLNCEVSTNHDYYGIFQTPTINLGKTMRGCSTGRTNEEVMLNMIKRALNSNFDLELINEYYQGDGRLYYDLFIVLRAMGMLKVQKYASFGIGTPLKLNVQSCLDTIKVVTNKNYDGRSYSTEGFQEMDFNAFSAPDGFGGR